MHETLLTKAGVIRLLVACSAFMAGSPALSDSWMPPHEFHTLSANGRFVARVVPGTKGARPTLIVSSVANAKTNEIWKTELGNRISPTQVLVSDDGESVVTFDNWASVGYGNDVAGIYGRKGQIANYSLEQIAPPTQSKDRLGLGSGLRGDNYRDKFPHSTSSRNWRSESVMFFSGKSANLHFCLWLDWESRWVAWRMSDGSLAKVSSEQTESWNAEGRQQALEKIKTDQATSADLNFLGRLRTPEDRPLIEAWLRDGEFSSGTLHSSSTDPPTSYYAFTSRSFKQEAADRILSRWDGVKIERNRRPLDDAYTFLGTLKGIISLPTGPAKGGGVLRVYLIPVGTPLQRWDEQTPEHFLIANFSHLYPYSFRSVGLTDAKLGPEVNFIIYGVTPGNFRIKAIWDRIAPHCDDKGAACQPSVGDFVSISSPVVNVTQGKTTDGVRVECHQEVK